MSKETISHPTIQIESGDQAIFSQWDSIIKLAGFTHYARSHRWKYHLRHQLHSVDCLGRDPTATTDKVGHTTEYFSRENQPAWFAASDIMPFLTLEATNPKQLHPILGKNYFESINGISATLASLDQNAKQELATFLNSQNLPTNIPQDQGSLIRTISEGNWVGLVDQGIKVVSSYSYQEIQEAQTHMLKKLYKNILRTVTKDSRHIVRQRMRELFTLASVDQADISIPDLSESIFHTITSHIGLDKSTELSYSHTDKSFKLIGENNQLNPAEFSFFDWYLKHRAQFDNAINKTAEKLKKEGENGIQGTSKTKGETPFWIVTNGQRYKLYITDQQLSFGEICIELTGPITNHLELKQILEDANCHDITLAPTAIPLALQLRSHGEVLLPEKGSSYMHQVDMVWMELINDPSLTLKDLKPIMQNGIIRTNPHTLDNLPDLGRIQLPLHVRHIIPSDSDGYINSKDLQKHWKKWVDTYKGISHQLERSSDITSKAHVLFPNPDEFLQKLILEIEFDTKLNNELATAIKDLKQIRKDLISCLLNSAQQEINNQQKGFFIDNAFKAIDNNRLPDKVDHTDKLFELIEKYTSMQSTIAALSESPVKDKLTANKHILEYICTLKLRAVLSAIESMEYFNTRPSLLTLYLLSGIEGVQQVINNVQVHHERPRIKNSSATISDSGGNSFLIYEDRNGNFNHSSELKHQLISQLHQQGLDSVLILQIPQKTDSDCFLKVLEKDGSFSSMCANGIRSIGQYYFSKYPNQAEIINIDTLSGETVQVYKSGELFTARLSEVNIFNKENIEKFNGILSCDPINLINSLLKNKQGLELISVSEILLEPHIIINAQPEISREELAILAKQIVTLQDNQGNPVFPNGININFIHQNSLSKLSVLTYERGVNDFTRACGTGVICSSKHILDLNNNQPVQITTAGGELLVEYDIEHYYLTGPATILGNIEI